MINQSQVICNWFDVEKSELEKSTKIALVVGNSNYESINKLRNPINDAKLMEKTFLRLGFDTVIYGHDLGYDLMKNKILEYNNLQKNYDIGFVYYAGHGLQDDEGNAYLIPVDFKASDNLDGHSISVKKLSKLLSYNINNKNILILDACRSTYESTENFKKPSITEPVNLKMGFSTSYGKVALDHPDLKNSMYTKTVSEKLLIPNLEIRDIFQSTWSVVYHASKAKQNPVEYFGQMTNLLKVSSNECE